VLAPSGHRGKPQPKRLREHVDQLAGKVQGQQQALRGKALHAVMPARADQELQPRPMPLACSPGEPPDRLGAHKRDRRKVPDRTDNL